MQVIRKETGVIREVEIENLSLEKPSVVRLKLAPEKVQNFGRRGNDLVLLLKDGSETVIKDFFVVYDDEGRNDLLLEDNEGVLWWGQYTSPWKNFHFTEIEWDEAALIPPWHHGGWLAAALGILGVGAAAGGGGGNSGSTPGGSGGGTEEGITPPLTPPAIVTPENEPIKGQIPSGGGTPVYSKGSDPAHGTVAINPDGSYTYTPNPGYHGPDSFDVVVTNPDGSTSKVTVGVTVTPVNDAPEAPDNEHKTPEDTPVSGRVEGSDPDGDNLTYTGGKPPAHGTVTIKPDGSYEYVPNPDWNGTDSFTVIVTDPDGNTTTSTITVIVTPEPDAPVANNDVVSGPEGSPVSGNVMGNDSDPDGDPLTVTEVTVGGITYPVTPSGSTPPITIPGKGTLVVGENGDYTFTPEPGWYGTVPPISYTITDGNGSTDDAVLDISVIGKPTNTTGTVNESGTPTGSTNDGSHITTGSVPTQPAGSVIVPTTGTTPNGSFEVKSDGTYTFTLTTPSEGDTSNTFSYVTKDEAGKEVTHTVTVNIVNDAPTADDDISAVTEGGTVTGSTVLGNDKSGADGWKTGGGVVGVVAGDSKGTPSTGGVGTSITGKYGTLTLNPDGSYTYKANPDVITKDEQDVFTYTVEDADGDCTTATLTINVGNVGVTGTTTNGSVDEAALDTGSSPSSPNGVSDGNLNLQPGWTAVPETNDTANGTWVVRADGTYSFTLTSPPDHSGGPVTNTFTYTATDALGNTVTNTVVITINDDVPLANSDVNAITEDAPVNTATGNVIGGVGSGAASTDVADATGADGAKVTGMQAGEVPVGSHVPDGGVSPVTGIPVKVDGKYGTLEIHADGSYTYTLDNTRPATQGLTDGEIADEVFSYTLTDADGDQSTASLTIKVSGRDDPVTVDVPTSHPGNPVSGDTSDHVVFESGLTSGSDPDADNTKVESSFTIDAKDGLDPVAPDTVTLSYKDNTGAAKTLTLTKAELEALGKTSQSITTQYGEMVLNGYSVDPDTGLITVSYTYTLNKAPNVVGDSASDVIGITVKDRDGDSNAFGSINIKIIDDIPVAVGQTGVALNEGGAAVGFVNGTWTTGTSNLLGNDKQGADGARVNTIKYIGTDGLEHESTAISASGSITVKTQYGSLTVHSDGNWSYTSDPSVAHGADPSKSDNFSYTLVDGDGDVSNWATQPIAVTDTAPKLGTPVNGTVDEDDLSAGTDPSAPGLSVSGSLAVTKGADAIDTKLSIDTAPKSLTSGGVAIEYDLSADGHTLIAYAGPGRDEADKVFTVTVTDPTGNPGYTFTLNGKLDHANANGENNKDLIFGFEAKETDNDGDKVNGSFTITVADDIPVITQNTGSTVKVEVDETALGVPSALATLGGPTGLFGINFGADGAAVSGSIVYALGLKDGETTGVASGLVDTATGSSVLLKLVNGEVVGYVSIGGVETPVFTLTVTDPSNGTVQLTQHRPIQHGDTNSHDDVLKVINDAINLGVTATDGDGDAVSDKVNIGDKISFKDDGPSITITNAVMGTVEVDETDIGVSATGNFAGAFNTPNYGHDGAATTGALTYSLEVGNGASGLLDTATGEAIVLSVNATTGAIEGKLATSGTVAFTISVNANGDVTLTQSRSMEHPDGSDANDVLTLPNDSVVLKATVKDGDGDTSNAFVNIGGQFQFLDDAPVIGKPTNGEVFESALENGSNPAGAALTVTNALNVTKFGADGAGDVRFTDTGTKNTVSELEALGLKSAGYDLVYKLSNDGHTLTATANGQPVFTVQINNPGTTGATYTFTLLQALDNLVGGDITTDLLYRVVDGDGDWVEETVSVLVKDDAPQTTKSVTVDEDGTTTFNTSADGNTGTVVVPPKGSTDGPSHGTVTIDGNGKVTYKPDHNYSGGDSFTVTSTDKDGTVTNTVVTVTVEPVSDKPTITVDAASVTTNEDEAVALGLNAPMVSDRIDENDAAAGDSPERLGAIELSGVPAGAQLQYGRTTFDQPVGGGVIKIILSDGPHLNDLKNNPPAGTLVMTIAEFEELKLLPPAESHVNFTVTATVTSYEVDDTGHKLANVDGATSEIASVEVKVHAVTDPIDLKVSADGVTWVDSSSIAPIVLPSIDEDKSFDLSKYLQVNLDKIADDNTGADIDGSEKREISIEGLSVGTTVTVNGSTYTVTADEPVIRFDVSTSTNSATPGLPSITVTPPKDFSGDIDGIKVTLHAQDRDADDPNAVVTELTDSIYLNLRVDPMAGDVEVVRATTTEDTAVNFLAGVRVTDTSAGSEVINSVSFMIPTGGWIMTAPVAGEDGIPATGWSISGDGINTRYTITFADGELSQAQREAVLDGYSIKPPAHSSKDVSIDVSIKSTDTNNVGGDPKTESKEDSYKLTIEVTPVAERADTNTAGPAGNDVRMNGHHTYQNAGKEDEWYALGSDDTGATAGAGGFDLGTPWSNEDTSEKTYARLTPTVTEGDGSTTSAIGSTFRYFVPGEIVDGVQQAGKWVEVVYEGNPVDIPIEYLNSLQFKAPPNLSGNFSIDVKAYTEDFDEDTGKKVFAESGGARLDGILILPVVEGKEQVTLALNGSASGREDTPIPLSINPTSSDPSEKSNITIKNIPAGAKIVYGGVEHPANDQGEVKIENYDASKGVSIIPPKDSNNDFTLKISAQTVDRLDIPGGPYESVSLPVELDLNVAVKGVADAATVTVKTPAPYSEDELDAKTKSVMLKDLVDVALSDKDGSEKLTVRVTGLPADFSLSEGTVLGGTGTARVWLLTPEQLANVKVSVPDNFSGTVSFKVAGVTTENDGDSSTWKYEDVSFKVTPSAEATASIEGVITEDTPDILGFGIVHQNGDTDEVLSRVWIKVSDAVQDGFTLSLDGKTLADAGLTIVIRGGVQYYELSGIDAGRLAAAGKLQADGELGKFHYEYEVIDSKYGTAVTGSDIKQSNSDFTIKATAVTDAPVLGLIDVTGENGMGQSIVIDDGDNKAHTTTVNSTGKVTVNVNVTSDDMDGSEHVIRVLIEGVPEGVTVTGAVQTGDNTWVLVYEGAAAKAIAGSGYLLPVEFNVGLDAGGKTSEIKITVQSKDNGNDNASGAAREEASIDWTLKTDFTTKPGDLAPTIDKWVRNDNFGTEDAPFSLNHVIDGQVTIKEPLLANVLTVTLTDVPADAQVSGMTLTWVKDAGGVPQPVWTASVTVPAGTSQADAQAALDKLLNDITITPPANQNENSHPGEMNFNATLTASVAGGSSNVATIPDTEMIVPVAPVTDNASLTISVGSVGEGTKDIPVTVNVSAGDGQSGQIVGGKVYLKLDAAGTTDALEGGVLKNGNTVLTKQTITGVEGVPDGEYYVLDVQDNTGSFNLSYTPLTSVPGNVKFDAVVVTKESDISGLPPTSSMPTTGSSTGTVNLVNNGVTVVNSPITGIEAPSSNKSGAIELTGAGGLQVALKDTEGSDVFGTIMLKDLPVGFLVYVGADAASATLANNAGGSGAFNSWVLSESGGLPPYVAILPPKNWSGTIPGLKLSVESGEITLVKETKEFGLGEITVTPKADGLTMNTTVAFGPENKPIALNLNAAMKDPVNVGVNDASTESTTLELTGLGKHASFYVGGVQLNEGQVTFVPGADGSGGTYTITGLTQTQLDKLEFKQAHSSLVDTNAGTDGLQIGVKAWTVESGGGAASAAVTGEITLSVSKQLPNEHDNSLLWTGDAINGGAGSDTVHLRAGESLSGSELALKLSNIETLDLSVGGANSITNLTALDVTKMATFNAADNSYTLKISGDAADTLTLGANVGAGWSSWSSGTTSAGHTTYTSTKDNQKVTVMVDEAIQDGSHARMASFSMPGWGELFSSDSGAINLDNVLPASSTTTTSLGVTAAGASSSDSAAALYAPLPQSALDDELHQLSVVHY